MEHINTFENGMTSDVAITNQPPGTYRFMKNCSLVSQDGNNYVVKDCIGNLVTFSLNAPYVTNYSTVGDLPTIIALISFPNKLISLITNNANDTGGYGEIGELKYLPYGEGMQPISVAGEYNAGYVPLYHHVDLKFSQLHRADGFSFIENELIERIYWTDNFNEPRVFNVSNPTFATYIPSGSIEQGKTYMVLEGAVEYPVASSNYYGPGLPNGNIFVGSVPNTTYTDKTGPNPTAKVIDYYPVELLNFVPDRSLGNITFKKYGAGSILCGSKVYYYRLGTYDGVVTSWSYGSSPVPVGKLNETEDITSSPSVPYHDFVGGGTSTLTTNSGLSVFLTIDNIDPNFDYIQVVCAEYDNLSTEARQTAIVYSGEITGGTMDIEHTGNVNGGDVTPGELATFPASIKTCKTLTTNKNYIIAGNIVERDELNLDFSGVTASVLYYPMPTHMDASSCSLSGEIYSGVSPLNGGYSVAVPTPAGSIYPNSKWYVTSGEASVNTVTYNGTLYLTGEVITGVTGAGNDQMAFAGTGAVVPCAAKNRYTTVASKRVENAIELQGTNPANTCFWDYKSAAVHHHLAGHWGGETYRYAVVMWDLKGNPYYARHMIDYTFPTSSQEGLIRSDEIGNTGEYVYSLNAKLISFSNIIIPGDVISKIKGFSIMRAVRDPKAITQGLVMQCHHTGATPDVVKGSAIIPALYNLNGVKPRHYVYLSPDLLCDGPMPGNVGLIGDKMEISSWVEAYDYSAGVATNGKNRARGVASSSEAVYSKLLVKTAVGAAAQPQTISFWGNLEEGQFLALGGGDTFSQEMNVDNGSVIDGTCGSGDYSLDAHNGNGGKKSVFKLESDFTYVTGSGTGEGYSTSSNLGGALENTTRILANYTRAGFSNPYGGTGDQSLADTIYISTGHYQPITGQVITDTQVGSDLVFNNVEIAGGDCYVCLVDVAYSLWNNGYTNKYSYALSFPCECNSNYNLRRGRKTSNSSMYYAGTTNANSIVELGASSEIRLEQFSYNPGYSTQGQTVGYPALPVNFINSSQFQSRIYHAGQKFIGEAEDSYRKFPVNARIDLSANYGRINSIKVKEDRVFVLQDTAISTVPVSQREVTSTADGTATAIGTGGVIDRWDVIDSFFGTQHQWSVTETEFGFVFFDMNKKALVALNSSTMEISQALGLKGFFGEAFNEIEGNVVTDSSKLLNSPTFSETSDRPLTGVGIISVYDPKFKMTYMAFKFYGQNSAGEYKSKDFTIGYLHTNTKKCFVSFYDWTPSFLHNHNQFVLSVNNPKNTTQYLGVLLTGKSFAVGETLWGGSSYKQKEYICYSPVTLDNVGKYPEGATGGNYWKLVNQVNQIQVLNQPSALGQAIAPDYVYNKFDGKVVNNEIWVVVNPPSQNPFSVLNIEQEGSTVNFTDIYTSGDRQSASETDIKSWSRFYRIIYDTIASSLPLSTIGRIVDRYLLIKFIKKNWTSDPTVLTGSVKIFRWLKSNSVQKR